MTAASLASLAEIREYHEPQGSTWNDLEAKGQRRLKGGYWTEKMEGPTNKLAFQIGCTRVYMLLMLSGI